MLAAFPSIAFIPVFLLGLAGFSGLWMLIRSCFRLESFYLGAWPAAGLIVVVALLVGLPFGLSSTLGLSPGLLFTDWIEATRRFINFGFDVNFITHFYWGPFQFLSNERLQNIWWLMLLLGMWTLVLEPIEWTDAQSNKHFYDEPWWDPGLEYAKFTRFGPVALWIYKRAEEMFSSIVALPLRAEAARGRAAGRITAVMVGLVLGCLGLAFFSSLNDWHLVGPEHLGLRVCGIVFLLSTLHFVYAKELVRKRDVVVAFFVENRRAQQNERRLKEAEELNARKKLLEARAEAAKNQGELTQPKEPLEKAGISASAQAKGLKNKPIDKKSFWSDPDNDKF